MAMGSKTMKEGKKNDFQDGKLRWDLLPLEEIEEKFSESSIF